MSISSAYHCTKEEAFMAKPNQANPSKNSSKKKKKITSKKLLSGPNAVAMKTKPSKENPFENIWSRGKFDALGKKRKGEQKRTGLARSRAIEKRKGTLLKEYEQSGKASVFVDKRIGEQNEELGEYDKALLRFQRERQLKLSKKSKFNLSDGEEDQDGGFTERDDFEDDMSPYDDADETEKKSDILKQLNAHNVHNPSESGSMEGEENKHKSKKEVMEEIILKSKFYKAEKAKDKEENELLMDQLDQNFTSLVQSKALVALTQPNKMNALKALLNMGKPIESTKKDELSVETVKSEPLKEDKPDAYDKLVKEMTLDMRARPSERTKTPEEIAQEERERLERLEEERQKRMLGADDSSDEGSDGHEDVKKLSAQKLRSLSGDDLGDSFNFDEDTDKKKSWLVKMFERDGGNSDNDNEDTALSQDSDGDEDEDEDEDESESESDQEDGSDEDDEEPGKTKSLKDWEQSDDDNLNTDSEEDTDEGDEVEEIEDSGNQKVAKIKNKSESTVKKAKSSGKQPLTKQETLPFVIEAPNSLEELCSLLENRSDAEVIEAVNRIRACNGVKLAAENRKKMQVFYGILLQYFAVLATKKPLKFNLLNLLVKPLVEMCGDTPYFAAICARQRILRTRTQFCEDVKNPEKSCWPSLKTLFLLRLWSVTFPCSDFRHVVMTPALLLMSEYLIRCPITSCRDIAIGSFLCSMVLSVTRQSKKFCPEAITFLRTQLMSASETEAGLLQHSQLCYFSELKMLKPWLRLRNRVSEIHPLDFFTMMTMPEDSPVFSSDSFRASVLVSVIEALRGFVNISEEYNSFPEIFLPISSLLQEVAKQENMPNILQDNIKDVVQLIEKKADEKHLWRQPLQMRKLKIVQIKQSNLKIEENFAKGRDYDPDRERAERRKLKKLLKQESKGAIRELRKDNHFLLEVKQKENAALQEERAEKSGKARAFLQEQEHAFKSGQLGKNKKRRR